MYRIRRFMAGFLVMVLALALGIPAFAAPEGKQQTDRKETAFVLPDASALDVTSCRYTQPEPEGAKVPGLLSDLTGYEKMLENDCLAVYFRKEVQGLRIQDKKTGYVWGGLSSDKPENMNQGWSAMANSLLTIDYLDANTQSGRSSMGAEGVTTVWEWGKEQGEAKVSFDSLGIALMLTLTLSEDRLRVEVHRDSIEESGQNALQSVWILPFLGTVEQDTVPGYMLLPDGSGALIRYQKSSDYVSPYNERIYGKDVSVDNMSVAGDLIAKRNNDYLTEMPRITMPVYGAVHGAGQQAYLAVVEEGAAYASVYASPAGIITDYNWTGVRFDYRNSYSYPVNKSGKSIITTQSGPEDFDCAISFTFLNGEEADYSGMAVRYRKMLEEGGALPYGERIDTELPIYLNVFGGEVKKGLLWNTYQRLTDVEELKAMTERFREEGIANVTVAYEGWEKGGASGAEHGTTKLDKRLGDQGSLEELKEQIQSQGGRFYLVSDPLSFDEDQARTASRAALTISKAYASITRSNSLLMYPTRYFARPQKAVESLAETWEAYPAYDLLLRNMGNMIYGDYRRNAPATREETRQSFLEALDQAKGKLMFSNPNDYMWQYTEEYVDMPMQNSQYLFETDSVPFLQIVLKGSVDYYAPYANQGFYNTSNILRMIEYGAYPSFVLMAASNDSLIDTPLEDYFSMNFQDWDPVIREVYETIAPALIQVEGARIQRHTALAEGVVMVSYDSGVTIYVNYTDTDFPVDGRGRVPAKGYLVWEGQKL